jgi:iron-sulfur cluster assembly protein
MQITLTPEATEKIRQFLEQHDSRSAAGLRVAVLPGGCSGFQYGLNIEEAPEEDDEVLELDDFRVFVDPFSAQYLEGVQIDYVSSMMGQGFSFTNPQASGGCGCGSSFTV